MAPAPAEPPAAPPAADFNPAAVGEGPLPPGFADERYDPLALSDATAALEAGLPIETYVTDLRALRKPWRPRTQARAARCNR
eukprot:10524077-Alexandrium_andersonii.AAC.1